MPQAHCHRGGSRGQGSRLRIRNLQSAKYLSIATTEKDALTGKMKAVEYRVKGPVALILTTTSVDMDYETQNRFITLTIDESPQMTERILARQRELETLEGIAKRMAQEWVAVKHQNAQRLLRPLAVVNPYAQKLTFPANALRARRDHKKYLGLIRAIAFLHQYQREVKTSPDGRAGEWWSISRLYPSDIEQANKLAKEVLGQTMGELSAPGRALLAKVRAMVKERANGEKELSVHPAGYPGVFRVERLPGKDPHQGAGRPGIPVLGDGQEGQGVRLRATGYGRGRG